jgi:hypothetical protein
MFGSKRKERASPEVIKSDDEEQYSPVIGRGRDSDRDSNRRRRGLALEGRATTMTTEK